MGMKDKFPVYQRDAQSVITASQRITVSKFVMRLKQDILVRKLERHWEVGEPWQETCWSKAAGLTAEELKAGATILVRTRQMVSSNDPIWTESLAAERSWLLDPSAESQAKYEAGMLNRKAPRERERRRKTLPQMASRRSSS